MQMFLIYRDDKSFDFTKGADSIKFSVFLYYFTCENHSALRWIEGLFALFTSCD